MSGRKQSNSFTLMAKPAATVIYTLACSPDSIAFRSDATGSFAANADKVILCRVKKNKGNEQTDVSLSNGTYDGLYLKYRKVFAYGTSGNWIASNQVTISYSDPVNNGVIGVEFCLATDSAVTDIIVSRVVSIVCDGNIGPTGGLGRMILPMGVWSSSTIYSSTAFHTPLVYYAGEYWYLNADTDQGTTPADTAGNPWTMARNFGMVITEAIFAPFAKFGGAIFAGNIIFSANGSIDGTDYVDGQEWKGYPAWSLFVGDPSEKAIKSGGTLNTYSYYTSSVALIPATTLAEGCYYSMFEGCSNLTAAPALPATTLAEKCYQYMFYGCSSLTTAPALPATTLANYCYCSMFEGSGLTTAPALPATTLVSNCYFAMFRNCSTLNSVTCLATSGINQSNSTANWLYGVAPSGTFTKASGANVSTNNIGSDSTWPRSNKGIPSNWDVVTDGPAETTITWTSTFINSVSIMPWGHDSGVSASDGGITATFTENAGLSSSGITIGNSSAYGITFSTTTGNISKIEIYGTDNSANGLPSGWSYDGTKVTWQGTSAPSVTMNGVNAGPGEDVHIDYISQIVFTIQ